MVNKTTVSTRNATPGWGIRTEQPAQSKDDVPALAAAASGITRLRGMPKEPVSTYTARLVWRLPVDGLAEDLPAWRTFTGQSREAVRGRGWLAAVHPQDRNHAVRVWDLALTTHMPFATEYRIRRRDGIYRWFSIHAMPISDGQGGACGWAGSAIDITARQEHALEREEHLAKARAALRLEERNRLLTKEQTACREAEAANVQLRALLALTDTALSHLALDDLLPALLKRLREVMAVDDATILLLDAAGQTLVVRAAPELEEAVTAQPRVPVGQGFTGRIAASRRPLIVNDLSTFPVVHPFLQERLRSVVGVPLMSQEHVLGVLHVGTAQPHTFGDADVQLLQRVAERVALAVERTCGYQAEQQARLSAEVARQEAEVALARARVSEARFQRLMDANIIGVAVSDGEQAFEANDAFLQLLGYSREDLAAGRISRHTANPPEYLSATEHALLDASARGVSAPFEKEYVRKDGTHVPVLVGNVQLQGEPLRFITFVLDLREQKRLAREREEALRSREAWFHTMADTAPVLLWVAGPDALVTFLNAPWLRFTGRSLEQELGNGWAEGVHPDDYQRCLDTYLTAFHARQPFTMEYRLRRFDGEYRWILDNGVPRYAPDGAFLGYIGSAIDFTEHLQLEREREAARANELALREVNQHMEEFLATAAHDLRNPVMAVYGFMELALMRLERLKAQQAASAPPVACAQAGACDSAETRRSRRTDPVQALDESLRAAQDGVERLSRLVTRLFDVARARAGTLELQLAPCDLAALVREQVGAQRAATPGRTIQLQISGTPGMSDRQEGLAVPVRADADRLGQVLANYLTNALKYSRDDAPIAVRLDTAEAKRTARVVVRDAGPGLPPEEQGRIWEPFHRAPGVAVCSNSVGAAGSLGLGLHICKTIIEGHDGQVGVESAEGQGSTFWFTLPLADVDERDTVKLHASQETRQ
jgi:PAS domain S-box-containing protein